MDAYTLVDLSTGASWCDDTYSVELYVKNLTDENAETNKYAQCAEGICGAQVYSGVIQPRTVGLRFAQQF